METATPALLTTPVEPHERIQLIDVLRGFALFGVLTANIWLWFSGIIFLFPDYLNHLKQWNADAVAHHFISIFISGKFISIFSFLFGLGFAIQMMRAEERGASIARVYSRRLAALVAFGATHAVFLWYGDILLTYALIGFGLLLFRKRKDKTILIWAGIFLVLLPLIAAGIPLVMSLLGSEQPDMSEMLKERAEENAALLHVYAQGSYTDLVRANLKMLAMFWFEKAFRFIPILFGLFLLGLYAGRRQVFRNVEANQTLFRKALRWGLPIGLIGNVGVTILSIKVPPTELHRHPVLGSVFLIAMISGMFPMAAFYIALITRLFQIEKWRRRLAILAPVGRMALTNYLSQTIICLSIFYGLGLGLIGKVGPALCLPVALAIFAIQIPVSHWWLRHFRFGPMEWLWRSITYARLQPMRLPGVVTASTKPEPSM